MKVKNTLVLLLCLVMVFAAGCQNDTPTETTPPTTITPETTVPTTAPPDPTEIYTAAIEALGTQSVRMLADITKTVTVAGQVFTSESSLDMNYWNIGTDEFLASVEENAEIGSHIYKVKELYGGGKVYQTLADSLYTQEMTAEDYTSRYPTLRFLDPQLYLVTLEENDTLIRFSEASGVEEWLGGEEAELISAEGIVKLNSSGAAESLSYTAEFRYGHALHTYQIEITYLKSSAVPQLPTDTDSYITLKDIDGPVMLDMAYGYLQQAKQFSTTTLSSTQSQAAGFVINIQQSVHTYLADNGTDYKIDTSVFAMDSSGSEEQETEETFIDGVYSIANNGEEPAVNNLVKAEHLKVAADQILETNIWANDMLTDAEITNLGSLLLIEYTCSEDFAQSIQQDISATYLGDPHLLDEYATSYKTNKMEYYLALDLYTMLPTAVGYLYEGCHTIDGYECLIIDQADQSFDLASLSSHDAIYEEAAPDVEPETKATPLFYKVTGENGQQMWLFGTIHVGDDRTAFLPQEITDALLSSHALAVECDVDGFYEQVEEDEQLSEEVSSHYYYTDGTIVDHLDTEDLYEDARKVMRATGSYFFNADYQKASLWSSSISNYYLSQGHQLVSEKGVESRLEKLAEENGIPLWEVESTLFQIKMTTGYSDHLQEFDLYSSVYSHGKENWEATAELYELWCAGDEGALTEEMVREVWAFTEEDLAEAEAEEDLTEEDRERIQYIRENMDTINEELEKLYQEYVTAMEIDRNAGMLEVAKEYLESGKTVFYAVGLAHLLAEDGLVNTLRDAGYTVELVTFG